MVDVKTKRQVIEEAEERLAQLVEERRKLEHIDQEIVVLRNFIANAKHLWNLDGTSEQKLQTVHVGDALTMTDRIDVSLRRPSVADAAREILQAAGHPMHVRQILTELQKRGFQLNAKYPTATIVVALKRRPDEFVKVRPNTFALRKRTEMSAPS